MTGWYVPGSSEGGGGGGGGGTGWDPTWTPILDLDYEAMADVADLLTGGDGERTIGGFVHRVINTSNMTSLQVGASYGGLRMGVGSDVAGYLDATRAHGAILLDLWRIFDGTPYAERHDVEVRITVKDAYEGVHSTTPSFEYRLVALESETYDGNKRFTIYRGSESSNAGRRRCWFYAMQGTVLSGVGKQDYTNTDLGYFPNIVRMSLFGGYSVGEFSSSDSAEIGDQMLHGVTSSPAGFNYAVKSRFAPSRTRLVLSRHTAASAQLTALVTKRILIEARAAAQGIGGFAPAGA